MSAIGEAWSAWVARLDGRGWGASAILRPPADPAAMTLEGVHGELAELLALADGQMPLRELAAAARPATNFFPGYAFLALAEARRAWDGWADIRRAHDPEDFDGMITVRGADPVRRVYTHAAWWPFAEDGGGNHLMVDLDPPAGGTLGQVIVAGPDEDERRVLAPGLGAYLDALLIAPLDDPDPGALADGVAWWDAPALR